MNDNIKKIYDEIVSHESNREMRKRGYKPLFSADERARIVLIGQAPGIHAQSANKAWDDASGIRLMQWLGVDETLFRDPSKIAIIPMDFYYPGKGKSGDLPPRKEFASYWHPRLLSLMPDLSLFVLIGQYAQKYYLRKRRKKTVTETVKHYEEYLPKFFPIVHPSPLNFRWINKHPWFVSDVLPELQSRVQLALKK